VLNGREIAIICLVKVLLAGFLSDMLDAFLQPLIPDISRYQMAFCYLGHIFEVFIVAKVSVKNLPPAT